MSEEKIISLETTLAHHEAQIQDMSEMIGQQWKEIDRLKQRLDRALARLADAEGGPGGQGQPSATEKPPHY